MSAQDLADTPTKKRRLVNGQSLPASPISPAVRALTGLRSWLSPWRGNSSKSAAFGAHDDNQDNEDGARGSEDEGEDYATSQSPLRHKNDNTGGNTVEDNPGPLYPPLPAAASPSLRSIAALPRSGTAHQVAQSPSPGRGSTSEASPASPFPFTFSPPRQARQIDNPFTPAAGHFSPSHPPGIPHHFPPSDSPLRNNYSLLARFFAQKAAEESGPEGSHSENRLTEEELLGCFKLIEESGRSVPDVQRALGLDASEYAGSDVASEVPLRRGASRSSWLSPSTSMDNGIHLHGSRQGQLSLGSAVSDTRSSFLAPRASSLLNHSLTEPSLFARSLVGQRPSSVAPSNAALPAFASSASVKSRSPAPRRRRPLYLGPGMSSSSSMSALAARRTTPAKPKVAPIAAATGKRQRLDATLDDDPIPPTDPLGSSSVADTSNRQNPFSLNTPQVGLPDSVAASSSSSKPLPTLSSKPHTIEPIGRQPTAPQTRTASAVLSILAQPDLPKLSASPRRSASSRPGAASTISAVVADVSAQTSDKFRPDSILNPYQTTPGLALGISTRSSGKSRTSEALEKMKDERRRSSRLRKTAKSDASDSGSLLDKIEKTKPIGLSASTHRLATSPAPTSETSQGSLPATVPASAAASSSKPLSSTSASSANKSSEEKTAEARRRLEQMKAASNTTAQPATPASSQTHAHMPGRPSRLSIAFNAGESPSSASTTGDESRPESIAEVPEEQVNNKATSAPASRFSFQASASSTAKPAEQKKPASTAPASTTTFTFQPSAVPAPAATSRTSARDPSPAPFVFSAPKPAAVAAPTSSAPKAPFSFTAPQTESKAAADAAPSAASSDSHERALAHATSGLPRFDLSVSFTSRPVEGATTEKDEALKVPALELPQYALGGDRPVKHVPFTLQAAPPGNATPAPAKPSGNVTTPETSAPETTATTSSATVEAGNGEENPEASSTSALLGSGQGEEDESTLFETRAKFWQFKSAKWEDAGIGIARVKSKKADAASKRLLVRNEGNGAVMINFRLRDDFKATLTATSLAFTGFDLEGKGLPMRCKVKTAEKAEEFKSSLEGSK